MIDRKRTAAKTYAPRKRPSKYGAFRTFLVKMIDQVPWPKSWYAAWPKIAATVNRPSSAMPLVEPKMLCGLLAWIRSLPVAAEMDLNTPAAASIGKAPEVNSTTA